MSTQTKFLPLGGFFLAGIIFLLAHCGKGDETIEVLVESTRRKDITEKVSISGSIEALDSRVVSAENSARISEIHVELGQEVDSGDLLISLDADFFNNNLELSEIDLNRTKADLSRALAIQSQARSAWKLSEKQYTNQLKAYNKGLISESELDGFESNFIRMEGEYESSQHTAEAANFSVKAAEISIKSAQKSLQQTSIYAPTGGVITELNVSVGETIVGTDQIQGSNILTITNFDTMLFRAEIAESDIPRVHLNDSASVVLDAYPGQPLFANVHQLPLSPKQEVDLSQTFEVVLRVSPKDVANLDPEQNLPLRPGMRGNASIFTEHVENALCVPLQCVTVRPNAEGIIQEVVFVVSEGTAQVKNIVAGVQDEKSIEIISGIEEGDRLISGPYDAIANTLEDGDAIIEVSEEKLFNKE